MKKVLGTFERTACEDIMNGFYIVMTVVAMLCALNLLDISVALIRYDNYLEISREGMIVAIRLMMTLVLMAVNRIVRTILIAIMPQDFEYHIMLDNGYIIFGSPKNSPQIINESFEVSKKTLYYLVLKDEEDEIKIPYNRKVLKVLKEIQK